MTISKDLFLEVWTGLETRFGKQAQGSAANYMSYLSPLMGDEEFRAAARAVWASREFFPRPNDFLLIRQGQDWEKVQEAAKLAGKKEDWGAIFRSMTESGQRAIKALGGIFVIEERMQRTPDRIRRDFQDAYDVAVSGLAFDSLESAGGYL
jgi:acetoin utilization deacetylase AcuC-like enzyme